jgi:pimeloyl-ACP methyl ester carboxylesterase
MNSTMKTVTGGGPGSQTWMLRERADSPPDKLLTVKAAAGAGQPHVPVTTGRHMPVNRKESRVAGSSPGTLARTGGRAIGLAERWAPGFGGQVAAWQAARPRPPQAVRSPRRATAGGRPACPQCGTGNWDRGCDGIARCVNDHTWTQPRHDQIRSGRQVIATKTWGGDSRGKVVVLVHGLGDCSKHLGLWAEALSHTGLVVVAVDVPGHGRSSRGRSLIRDFFTALDAVVGHLGTPYGVVGHSMGALPAAILALEGRCDRLALAAPLLSIDHALDIFAARAGIGPRTRKRMDRPAARIMGAPLANFDVLTRAAECDSELAPLLLIHDKNDRVFPISRSHDLVAAWPGPRQLVPTTGLRHRGILDHPPTARLVAEFMVCGPGVAAASTPA